MKKFFKFAALVAIAAVSVSCGNEKPGPDPGTGTPSTEYTQDLQFTLELKEVDADQAKVVVEHNGTTADSWYGFATTETDIEQAIEDVIEEGKLKLQTRKKYTVTVKDLEPETDYTFVAVAVTADGQVYSEAATLEFTTEKAPVVIEGYTVNTAWTVTYEGAYDKYEHTAYVDSKDNNTYFVTAWPVEYYNELGIEEIAEAEISYYLEYLATTNYKFSDILSNESELHIIDLDIQYGTEWYVIAIGANADGTPSGLYALSEVVTLVEEEMTEGYSAWLGDWTFTGANGISQTVNFSKGIANKYFYMTGYENQNETMAIKVDWMEEDQIWVIYNQNLGQFNFGSMGVGDIWFIGENAAEEFYPYEEIPICLGGLLEDGTRRSEGYTETWDDESGNTVTYIVNDMLYLAYIPDYGYGVISEIAENGNLPTFPITITPATKASSLSVKEFKGSTKTKRNLYAPEVEFMAECFNKSARIR